MLTLVLIFLLVLVTFVISHKVLHKVFPKLFYFIPYSILFGVVVLLIQYFYPAKEAFTELTNYMLAVIFALVPLSMQNLRERNLSSVKKLWLYSVLQHFVQWGFIGLIVYFICIPLFGINDNFISLIPGGFAGGHGSAAMMGEFFQKFSFPEMRSLLMATATMGMAFSILGGVFWLAKFKGEGLSTDLDDTGVTLSLKRWARPLFYLILSILLGYFISYLLGFLFKVQIPVFAGAFIGSFLLSRPKLKFIPDHMESAFFSDKATDLLVVFGIGSIQISVLEASLGAISLMWFLGLVNAVLMLIFVAPKAFGKDAKEAGMFAWGWSLGGLMMGFALLKASSTKNYADNLEKYSLAYMLVSPVEITLYMLMPWALTQGMGLGLIIGFSIIAITILFQLFKKVD